MIRLPFPATWLVPAATAARAVWSWAHEHFLQREKERARITALYVGPSLSACEDLQSGISKILELDGLPELRKRHPDGSHAEETLYILFRFFDWITAVNRYGPNTQDATVIRYSTAIRRAFATSGGDNKVGPFNFFAAEQTFETLHKAKHAKDIVGKERLFLAQNHLADLLNYLEKKLGYSYFPTTRKKRGSSMEAL